MTEPLILAATRAWSESRAAKRQQACVGHIETGEWFAGAVHSGALAGWPVELEKVDIIDGHPAAVLLVDGSLRLGVLHIDSDCGTDVKVCLVDRCGECDRLGRGTATMTVDRLLPGGVGGLAEIGRLLATKDEGVMCDDHGPF